jgi:hypothetical protein
MPPNNYSQLTSIAARGGAHACSIGKRIVEQAIRVWHDFVPMTPDELAALRARTAGHNQNGILEGYKTTGRFDGTINNPHWLTTATVSG